MNEWRWRDEPEWKKREIVEEVKSHKNLEYLQYGDPGYVGCKYASFCELAPYQCSVCTPSDNSGLEKEYQRIRRGE